MLFDCVEFVVPSAQEKKRKVLYFVSVQISNCDLKCFTCCVKINCCRGPDNNQTKCDISQFSTHQQCNPLTLNIMWIIIILKEEQSTMRLWSICVGVTI